MQINWSEIIRILISLKLIHFSSDAKYVALTFNIIPWITCWPSGKCQNVIKLAKQMTLWSYKQIVILIIT